MQEMDFTALKDRRRPSILSACVLGCVAVAGLWIASQLAVMIAPRAGIRQEIASNALYYLPFVLLPVMLCMGRRQGLSEAMRLNPVPVLPLLTVMFLAVVSVFAATELDALWVMLLNACGLHEPDVALNVGSSRALMLAIVNSAAVPAVCEELLFRGYILAAWERRGTWRAIWVSSTLFALLHSNVFGLPAYLLVGAISAYLVYALDSLYAGMVYHTVYNAAILVIVFLAGRSEAAATDAAPQTLWLATELAMLLAAMVTMLVSLDLRRRAAGIEPVPARGGRLRRAEIAALTVLVGALLLSTLAATLLGGAA